MCKVINTILKTVATDELYTITAEEIDIEDPEDEEIEEIVKQNTKGS